jgi:hypothetical protein
MAADDDPPQFEAPAFPACGSADTVPVLYGYPSEDGLLRRRCADASIPADELPGPGRAALGR